MYILYYTMYDYYNVLFKIYKYIKIISYLHITAVCIFIHKKSHVSVLDPIQLRKSNLGLE